LIDEYEFVVHPRLAGHGPTLFAGLSKHVDLKLVSQLEFGSGAVALRYEPGSHTEHFWGIFASYGVRNEGRACTI
jgi:dihydrofolate reductase